MDSTDNMSLIFRSDWGGLAVFLIVAAIGVMGYLWNRPTRNAVSRRAYLLLSSLHILAGLLLALWFVNPRIRYRERSSDAGGLAVAVDTSASMSVKDPRMQVSRFAQGEQILLSDSSEVLAALRETGAVSFFTFDHHLKSHASASKASSVRPAGRTTDLAATLKALASEARVNRLHGIVVATDGRTIDRVAAREAARTMPVPVYTVGLGSKADDANPWENVGIVKVECPTRLAEAQEVELTVTLEQSGYAGTGLQVSLEEGDTTHQSEYVSLSGAERQMFALRYTPRQRGTRNLKVRLKPPPGDKMKADNSRTFSVMVDDRTLRVLYVEGRLRWNYKFLRRILESEATIDADCVVRTGGAKLYQQGDADLQLRGVLPSDLEGLKEYDVILLGDIPRGLLNDGQIRLLEKFVRGSRGGLFIIGGPELLDGNAYAGSPLERLLPAGLTEEGKSARTGNYRLSLSVMGRSDSALSGLREDLEKVSVHKLYALKKPGAGTRQLIEAKNESSNESLPILLSHRLGEGRVMLLTTEDLWQPALYETGSRHASPMARFWLQSIQWLARQDDKVSDDAPTLMGLTDRTHYEPGETVEISAYHKTSNQDIQATIRVQAVDSDEEDTEEWTKVQTISLSEPGASGALQATWTPEEPGNYAIMLRDDIDQSGLTLRFSVGHASAEMARTSLDEDLLRRIGNMTGGGYYTAMTLPDMPKTIEQNPLIQSRLVEKDVLDSPFLLMAFILIVSTGWTIRRRRNLI